jgi:hypothetical protein
MKLSFAVISVLLAASATAQQRPSSEAQPYSLEANSFIDALLKISAHFQIPVGVEWLKSADTLTPFQLSRHNVTAANAIQSVVSNHRGYEWRMEGGVVHVYHRDLINDKRNPLNITIKEFDQQPETVAFASNNLFQRVQQFVRTPELHGIAGSVLGYPGEPTFNFAAQNVLVRSILNEIVRAGLSASAPHMKRVWISTFPDKPVFSRTGFLEVVPIWNPQFVSNDSQPYWILLAWGDPPPEKMLK